jgi:hypothetical protein
MTAIKLDRTKPFGEIIGSTDGARYDQDGRVFGADGNLLNTPEQPAQNVIINELIKRKPGRPPKNDMEN